MSTITGLVTFVIGDGRKRLEAGRYAGIPTGQGHTKLECPYCHDLLLRYYAAPGELGRITYIVSGHGTDQGTSS